MFCSNCGKELADGTKFCSQCGKQMTENVDDGIFFVHRSNDTESTQKMTVNDPIMANRTHNARVTGGAIQIVIGIVLAIIALVTYCNDTSGWFGYSYTAPLTAHEVGVIMLGIIGVGCLIFGIIALVTKK